MHVGTKHMHINVVDIEFHQLVRSWMVSVISQSPVVNKTFQLQLPVGGGAGSNQRISFTNPYAARRLFRPLRVVAPTSVKRGIVRRTLRALGP